ncbi:MULTISPECIES: site-specific integrase [unclassified Caballeronia]|uniref:site-specific integrase n=1 Tax=unclassified Caballeronia TaxID=2646786 RepID=UPI0028594D82|nr:MULTISPECIES: site-specific integrase [unclassified Caballeronia]MDR5771792.1 site-specific integrase [Caballeronia sp. LZ002]MDR5847227.1 site-specific integrase [Caballeronia sp. LZ003]
MATIIHRPDNVPARKWQAKVRRKGFPAQSKAFASRAEAEVWARSIETEYDKGHTVDHSDARDTILRGLLRQYLSEVVPRQRGFEPEGHRVRFLMRQPVTAFSLTNLTRSALVAYRDNRLRTVSGSTVRKELLVMRRAIEFGRKELGLYLAENPLDWIRLPDENEARDRRLLPGEEERLLVECQAARAPYLLPLVVIAIETGMRQSEMLGLTWERIDTARRVVYLPTTKNGQPRGVPLTRRAVQALESMRNARVYQWSREPAGGPFLHVSATVVRHAFMRARDKAGMHDLRFHDLRHEAVSRLFERGLNVMEVGSISGHKTLSMLRRYSHLSMDHLLSKLD